MTFKIWCPICHSTFQREASSLPELKRHIYELGVCPQGGHVFDEPPSSLLVVIGTSPERKAP